MDEEWRSRGLCRNKDPELFFPVGTTGPAEVQIAEAKKVCFRCPVRVECLNYAQIKPEDFGVWGGTTEEERRATRRRRRVEARTTLVEVKVS